MNVTVLRLYGCAEEISRQFLPFRFRSAVVLYNMVRETRGEAVMRTVPLEGNPLDERLIYPEEPGADRCADLESGFVRTMFRDQQGVEHRHIYTP